MKSVSGNSIVMKEINKNIVRNALKAERQATKHELSQMTGLSTVTVGTILQELTVENEAYEDERLPSGGGRPPKNYCYNGEFGHVIVIYTHEDMGEDKMFISVANLFGECIYKQEEILIHPNLNTFESIIDKLLEEYQTIKAIGFGMPGFEYNEVVTVHDYKEITGTRFTEHYKERYNLPVIFENDVNAAVAGYCTFNHIERESAVVYIFFPEQYPPGAGICINGNIYKGFTNFAGEVDQMPIGIDWRKIDYDSFEATCDGISKLVTSITCILNPQEIILSGAFLTEQHVEKIKERCNKALKDMFVPELQLSASFHIDYERGVIKSTLDLLTPKLSIYGE